MRLQRIRTIAIPVAAALAAGLLLAPGSASGAADGGTTSVTRAEPLPWHVYARVTNTTDRVLIVEFSHGRRYWLEPSEWTAAGGTTGRGHDLEAEVRWCAGWEDYDHRNGACAREERVRLRWKNPVLGYPWMETSEKRGDGSRIEKRIRFSVGEVHRWVTDARSRPLAIVGERKRDQGAKVWHVTVSNA
jgi:hypothetical protein